MLHAIPKTAAVCRTRNAAAIATKGAYFSKHNDTDNLEKSGGFKLSAKGEMLTSS
ncbi:hypothetical protein [Paenibacillus lactis]|uniref:hypothetical protein n=1 Tax=Paenibacillus lactis TaxID=228574 RepID=UPI0004B16C1B